MNQENKSEITFTNVLAVVDYLKAHDWKAGKSLVYIHKKEGKLRPQKDGLFHLKDVEKYAANFLHRTDGSSGSEIEKYQEEKARAELDKTKEQLEHLRIRNKVANGLYVPKDAFERELAQRAMIFKADAEAFCRMQSGMIISLVGGDKDMAPDLTEYMLGAIAGWLSRYATDREFIVPAAAPENILADPGDDIDRDDDE